VLNYVKQHLLGVPKVKLLQPDELAETSLKKRKPRQQQRDEENKRIRSLTSIASAS
jgi:hypothetical protein